MDGGDKEEAAAADTRKNIKKAARREPVLASNTPNRTISSASSLG
jgi:hypothetical protein